VVLAGFAGLAGFLDLVEGNDCAILSSKWTIGFLVRIDRRSEGSAIVNSFNLVVS
jgi:hypothetical protein